MTNTNIVRGQVKDVRALKDTWGRIRLLAGSAGEVSEVLGPILGLAEGDTIEARGEWRQSPRYGRQFHAQTVRTVLASDAAGAVAWLSSRLPGLGRKRATALVERFGLPGLYEVIAHRPHELAEVRGITPATAEAIAAEYERVRGEAEEMTTLLGWGLTDAQVRRCREAWGTSDVSSVLRENPYRLAEDVVGFGFGRSDQLARRMGLDLSSAHRVRAGLVHLVREAEGVGHCYVPRRTLVALGAELLGLPVARVAAVLAEACDGGPLVDDEERIYRPELLRAEELVADLVLRARRAA